MTGLPVADAARELGVSVPTLRRWLRAGAPIAHRGRRGRGCAALVDPVAVASWRRQEGGTDALLAFAGRIPEIVAAASMATFREVDGPHKRAFAGALAAGWYLCSLALLDALRADGLEVSGPDRKPEAIILLQKIARG